MTTVIERFDEVAPRLMIFHITKENVNDFFDKRIAKCTVKDIEQIAQVLNEVFPELGIEKKKSSLNKEGYIKYVNHLVHNPFGTCRNTKQKDFVTPPKCLSKQIIYSVNEPVVVQTDLGALLDARQKRFGETFSSNKRSVRDDSSDSDADQPIADMRTLLQSYYRSQTTNSFGNPFGKPTINTTNNPSIVQRFNPSRLPIEFFETQHPQYLVDEILFCNTFNPSFNNIRFNVNTSSKLNNQRIILRLFDSKRNKECSEIYFIQLSVNSSFIDLNGMYQPIYGQPHSEPAVVRQPIDITNYCFSTINSVAVMVNKPSPEVVVVASLCTYREVSHLLREILDGTNLIESKRVYEKICQRKAPEVSPNQKEIEVIDLDQDSDDLNGRQRGTWKEGSEKDDIIVGTNIVSLRCPLSFLPITIPVKGLLCKHSTVINAKGLVEFCLKNNYWNCPLCEKKCYFNSIVIDKQLLNIINEAPKDCCCVEIDENGKVVKYINDIGEQCEDSQDVDVIDLD